MKSIFYFSFIMTLVFSCLGYSELFCAVGYNGEFTQIDPLTGEVGVKRTDLPKQLQALSWSPNGTLYAGTNSGQIYSINPFNGNYAFIRTLSINNLRGMAFSSDGLLYITAFNYFEVVDLASGQIRDIGQTVTPGSSSSIIQGLAFSPEGILYGITPLGYLNTYGLYTIDTANAAVHDIATFTSTANVNQSLAFTSDGKLFAVGQGAFAQLNPIDGTVIGRPVTLQGDYRGLELVPEPISLFYLALGALTVIKKRKL
jgi:WD40 repeat protein